MQLVVHDTTCVCLEAEHISTLHVHNQNTVKYLDPLILAPAETLCVQV